jgi:hypothetical protein
MWCKDLHTEVMSRRVEFVCIRRKGQASVSLGSYGRPQFNANHTPKPSLRVPGGAHVRFLVFMCCASCDGLFTHLNLIRRVARDCEAEIQQGA